HRSVRLVILVGLAIDQIAQSGLSSLSVIYYSAQLFSPFRDMVLATLNKADIPWRLAYVASTLPAVRAAVKAGLGVTARPVEMMSPDLRVLSGVDGLPPLPDTEYLLCYDPSSNNELAQVIYQAMESYHNPWQYSPMSAPEGDDSLLIERDIE
ncbi:LysR substrate-binding domain-containing protein, partial [Escherichia coli]|uniref:LysR substrate-binding domain-containing protein n=1 Tax=Escherichia coli TaxID=562 RepID=UPI003F916478